MRLLFLSHYFPPEGNAPANRTYENCRRWSAEGRPVTVVTCAPNCPDGVVFPGYRNRLKQRETVGGVEVLRVWTFIAPNKGTVRRTLNYLSYMVSATLAGTFVLPRPEIVVATSPQFFCGWAGVLVAKARGVPFVLEIRDIWPESISAVGALHGRGLFRVLEWMERTMYRAADHIVTVGDGYKQRLLERGVPEEKISVVMNGVDEDFVPRAADAELLKRYGLAGKFVVTYAGTIGMACGLDVTLRAAELLRARGVDDVVFLLVGSGAERENLEAEVRRRGLEGRVILTGRVPRAEIPAFVASSDACLVHLRKTDLFASVMPSKIFEAAGMAKPIILGVGGFAREFVERAGAGLVMTPDDENELVAAVLRLKADDGLRRTLGESGERWVRANCDRGVLAARYLEILERVAAGRAPVSSRA